MSDLRQRASEDEFEADQLPLQPLWKRPRVLVAAAVLVAVTLFLLSRGGNRKPAEPKLAQTTIAAVVPYVAPPPASVPNPPPSSPPPSAPPPPPQPGAPPAAAAAWPAMMTYAVDPPAKTAAPRSQDDPETKFAFKTAALPGLAAGPAMDLTYVLLPGLIFCELDIAIESSVPGPLQCHLPSPVYSQTGTLLMEAGTHIYGVYQSMEQGSGARLRATSTFAITPNGVPVPLGGEPWADPQGRIGLSGGVDYHTFSRFGGAVLLDLSQSALGIAQAEVSKGGNSYVSLNSSGGLASQILQGTIDQPPTFEKHPGDWIAIWLRSPVSFKASYRIRPAIEP
jgi:type IV secretion system protein VirB10